MSLDMSTVTGIQIPITTTTYRELEYINIVASSGNFIDTGDTFVEDKYRAITVQPNTVGEQGHLFGFHRDTNYYFGPYVNSSAQVMIASHTPSSSAAQSYTKLGNCSLIFSGRSKVKVGMKTRYTNSWGYQYWANALEYSNYDFEDIVAFESWVDYVGPMVSNNSYKILLCAANDSGLEIYECKLYRYEIRTSTVDGQLESDYIPCQRKSDGKVGMYDRITNTFHELKGTQYITGNYYRNDGPVVNEYPSWSPGSTLYYEVTKIEDYYNGNLRQIWPCYSAGPSNPDAPVVSNAFDYDDNITWTVGTGVENTDEYYYYPITATGQANGIQIAVADNPNGWNDDGKPTSNTTYTWYVQAERAGYYQMVMSAKMSSAGHATTGYWSGANIQVNGSTSGVQKLELYGDTPDFDAVDYNDIVVAIVPLTGYEDAVSFQQSSWRIVVDPTSNIIFREIAATSPAFLTLDTTNVTTSYTQGDTFSYSGLVVYQTLANGTANTISSGYTVSSPDMSTTGTKTVTVTYGGLTASYDITVASAGATWVTTATLTNSDNKTVEQGTCGGYDAVRIGVLDYSTGGFGSDGRVSSTSTDEVYKITPPSAGDYMLVLPIRRGSGDPQFYINGNSIGAVYGTSSSEFLYIEITYPITLTSGENTLTIRNNSYRCYWDTDDYVYLVKSSTNPFS